MSVDRVIQILMHQQLLMPTKACSSCGPQMKLRKKNAMIDKVCWCCVNRHCVKYQSTMSIRTGSFFESFRSSLSDIFTVIILWSLNKQIKDIVTDYGLSKSTFIDIVDKLRHTVHNDLVDGPVKLGGLGIVCQIDESLLSRKAKYNVGRQPSRQVWVGIVDCSFKPAKGHAQIVENRSAATLLPIIGQICRPGTIIHSDSWAAYNSIQSSFGFEHEKANHKFNFIDPETGTHTQNVESYWNRIKLWIKAMKGVSKQQLPHVLSEFVWKDQHRERSFVHLMGLLRAN